MAACVESLSGRSQTIRSTNTANRLEPAVSFGMAVEVTQTESIEGSCIGNPARRPTFQVSSDESELQDTRGMPQAKTIRRLSGKEPESQMNQMMTVDRKVRILVYRKGIVFCCFNWKSGSNPFLQPGNEWLSRRFEKIAQHETRIGTICGSESRCSNARRILFFIKS